MAKYHDYRALQQKKANIRKLPVRIRENISQLSYGCIINLPWITDFQKALVF